MYDSLMMAIRKRMGPCFPLCPSDVAFKRSIDCGNNWSDEFSACPCKFKEPKLKTKSSIELMSRLVLMRNAFYKISLLGLRKRRKTSVSLQRNFFVWTLTSIKVDNVDGSSLSMTDENELTANQVVKWLYMTGSKAEVRTFF